MHTHTQIYIYIYRDPEIDRISDIFKKDFQKRKKVVGIFSKPCVSTRFSSLLKSFLGHFGHGSGEILKKCEAESQAASVLGLYFFTVRLESAKGATVT